MNKQLDAVALSEITTEAMEQLYIEMPELQSGLHTATAGQTTGVIRFVAGLMAYGGMIYPLEIKRRAIVVAHAKGFSWGHSSFSSAISTPSYYDSAGKYLGTLKPAQSAPQPVIDCSKKPLPAELAPRCQAKQ